MAPRKSTNLSRGKSASAARESAPSSPTKKAPATPAKKKAAASAPAEVAAASSSSINMNIRPARYYAQIPEELRTKQTAVRKNIFGKIASSLLGGDKQPAEPRDFPFMTAAGPQFFCTDKKSLLKQFGVSHNDRLSYTVGPLAGTYCSVIGSRGGQLWVVNDISKRGSEVPRPSFVEKDHSGAFDFGFATPLHGIDNKKDLSEAGIKFIVKGGTLNQANVDEYFPAPLVDFLRYAPDMWLKIPETNDSLVIPPILTPTGEIGWASAGAFNAFAPEGVDQPTEARALVSIVPHLVPVEYLSDNEE